MDEHHSHIKNFGVEMYIFADDRRERDRYVNILHLGTDLGAARPEMDRLVRRMKWGYGVEHKTGLGLSDDREMLLAGIDTDMLIGDKSPIGLGSVDLKSDLGGAALDTYTQYLGDCADAIRATLDGLVAGKMQ